MVDVTGLSVAVTIPAGGRRLKITAFGAGIDSSHAAASTLSIAIREGSTTLTEPVVQTAVTQYRLPSIAIYSAVVAAGAHTYKVSIQQNGTGTMNLRATATSPAFILVELI